MEASGGDLRIATGSSEHAVGNIVQRAKIVDILSVPTLQDIDYSGLAKVRLDSTIDTNALALVWERLSHPDFKPYTDALLKSIATPSKEEIWEKVKDDRHIRALIAQFTIGARGYRDRLTVGDMETFLQRNPLPNEFLGVAQGYINGHVKIKDGEEKADKYTAALGNLMQAAYGKRYEYSEQLNILIREANTIHNGSHPNRATAMSTPVR